MKDRTFERGQGCWNCTRRMSHEDMKKWWAKQRQGELEKLLKIALTSQLGERDQRVVNGRRMIDMVDHSAARSEIVHCTKGITAKGAQVGDITPANYLCTKWTGMQGSSLARIDGKTDKLPEELLWEEDGGKPTTIEKFAEDNIPANELVQIRQRKVT